MEKLIICDQCFKEICKVNTNKSFSWKKENGIFIPCRSGERWICKNCWKSVITKDASKEKNNEPVY